VSQEAIIFSTSDLLTALYVKPYMTPWTGGNLAPWSCYDLNDLVDLVFYYKKCPKWTCSSLLFCRYVPA